MTNQLEGLLLFCAIFPALLASGLQYTGTFGPANLSLHDGYDDDISNQAFYLQKSRRPSNNSIQSDALLPVGRRLTPAGSRKSNNTNQMPSYQIIGAESPSNRPKWKQETGKMANFSKLTTFDNQDENENEIDFSNDMLNPVGKLRERQSARKSRPPGFKRPLSVRNSSVIGGHQDDYTINLLLNMLMLANRKCADKHKESLAKLREFSIKNETETTSRDNYSRDSEEGEDLIENSSRSSSTPAKRRAFHDQLSSSSSIETHRDRDPVRTEAGQEKADKKSRRKGKSERRQPQEDFSRVKPGGYDKKEAQEEHLSASQDMSHNSAVSFPGPLELLGLVGHHEARPERHPGAVHEIDLLHNHKPIVAHDLLDVHRQLNRHHNGHQLKYPMDPMVHPHHHQSSSPLELPMNHIRPEGVFGSRGSFERKSPLYDYLQGLQTPPEQPQPQPQHQQQQHQEYSGLNELNPFQHMNKPQHSDEAVEKDAQHLMLGPFSGGESINKPPVSLNSHMQTLVGNELDLQNQHQQPDNLPIQQMLMAAKNQQAAIKSYENRRLQHELEMQKQSEQIRRKHEEQLEKQRQEAIKGQQEQEREEQMKKKQQQAANSETGKDSSKQEGEGQDENNGENNNENNNDQEEPDSDQGNEQQQEQEHENDQEMNNLKNFADTDFTDLFPPGILSQEEIKEMRKQQEEQRKKQAEEESSS